MIDDKAKDALVDRIGEALERAYPGQVVRGATGATVTLTVPAADGAVGTDHNQTQPDAGPGLDLRDPEGVKSKNRPGGMNVGRLKSFLTRVEKLTEERKAISDDIRDVYSEAKGVGYDVATIRTLVRLRAMDSAERAERDALLDTYKHALGIV